MKKNIFWGIIFIGTAILLTLELIGSRFGINVPFIRLGLALLLAWWAVKSLKKGKVSGLFFPLAFIFMLFENDLSNWIGFYGDLVNNWFVLLIALLLTIGFAVLFKDYEFKTSKVRINNTKSNKNCFNDGIKYVDCTEFEYEALKNIFGNFTVYFQNVELYEGGGVLEINNTCGNVDIYLPENWCVINETDNFMGDVKTAGTDPLNGKPLRVVGKNNFGEIKFHYNNAR